VEVMGEGPVNLDNCYFAIHDGSTAAALYFMSDGAPCRIEFCDFDHCQKAAIGSAANASRPLTISHSHFMYNSAANNNIPQINITAAKPLRIEWCDVTGDPSNTMVGGIGISNFMGYDADITISCCSITNNRYGIGIVGPAAKIMFDSNTLNNNRFETNPMNGGSGISLYDPYQQTEAYIFNNRIKKSLWGVTVIGCKKVNLGWLEQGDDYNPGLNVFEDNGNNGQLYDLYNNSANTVYAQGNTWNVSEQTEELIGHIAGTINPFCLKDTARLYLDLSIRKHIGETVFPGIGGEDSVVELTVDELEKLSDPVCWVSVTV
jgi:hypothetical protein